MTNGAPGSLDDQFVPVHDVVVRVAGDDWRSMTRLATARRGEFNAASDYDSLARRGYGGERALEAGADRSLVIMLVPRGSTVA